MCTLTVLKSLITKEAAILNNTCYLIPKSTEFKETIMKFGSEQATVLVSETKMGKFFKPINRCYRYQFEEFFGFGCGNIDFTSDRVVFVPKTN